MKLYEKFPLNANRVHTIFMIKYFNPKPIEKGAKAFCSYLGFVRLAGSEKISKSYVESERYLESNYINNSLEGISKILNTISMSQADESPLIDYKENKLTYSLKNILNKKSRKIVIGHIYPLRSYHNEIIHTLQFIDRFQAKEFKLKMDTNANTMNTMERMVKRIMEENKEIVSEIKKINTVFRRKLEGIAEIISLKGDIEDHLKARMISQNYSKLRTLKENQEREKNLHIENEILTKKLKNVKHEFQAKQDEQDNMIKNYKSSLSSQKAVLDKLIQENNNLRCQIDQANSKNENVERSNLIELKNKGMTMMSTKSEFLLKAAELFEDKTDTLNKLKIFKEQGINEAEFIHSKDMKQVKDEIRTDLNLLDYEFTDKYLEAQDKINEELKKYQEKCEKKRKNIHSLRGELLDLYKLIVSQNYFIEENDNGKYTRMIKTCIIPKTDKIEIPKRETIPYTCQILNKKKFKEINQLKAARSLKQLKK